MKYTVQEIVAATILMPSNLKGTDNLVSAIRSILNAPVELPLSEAQEVIDALPHLIMMKSLVGRAVSDFTKSIAAILENPASVPDTTRLRILAYTFNNYNQLTSELAYRADLVGSQFVGEVGTKIEVALRIASCRHLTQDYGPSYFRAVGFDSDGNAYSFVPKRMLEKSADFSYKITGKIRKHEVNAFLYNAQITSLWYTKEV